MHITTNKLTKELKITREALFMKLEKSNLTDKNHKLTELGINIGGEYKKYMGKEYINWKDKDKIVSVLEKKSIVSELNINKEIEKEDINSIDIRKKYNSLEYRTEDGHYVRSKAELIIDNWLYNKGLVHAYEKKLPTKEHLLSDFYIPEKKIYIEYWGYENQEKYIKRKKVKQNIYEKYHFNLIELNDKDILNLDDILPRYLLSFGVATY